MRLRDAFTTVEAKKWKELSYCVRYDFHVRHLMVEKGKMDVRMLDFLFGMPLTVTLRRYGLSQKQIGDLAAGEKGDYDQD